YTNYQGLTILTHGSISSVSSAGGRAPRETAPPASAPRPRPWRGPSAGPPRGRPSPARGALRPARPGRGPQPRRPLGRPGAHGQRTPGVPRARPPLAKAPTTAKARRETPTEHLAERLPGRAPPRRRTRWGRPPNARRRHSVAPPHSL